MADRHAKKAKILFDPKEKEKHRVAALESIVELMESEEEKRVFFRDNIEYLCQLALDTFRSTAEKLENQRDFRDKFERAMGKGAAFDEIFAFPGLLQWFIEYGGTKFYDQPTLPGLEECVRRLVVPTSHPLLRREGLRLVFFWMKRKVTDEMRLIFATAIELRQFSSDPGLSLGQPDYPVCGKPLVEAPLSKQNQAETMFEDIFGLMTFDPDASRASLGLLWKEMQRAYLSLLYPSVFSEYKLVKPNEGCFQKEAPPRLQSILLKFIILWLQRDPEQPQVDRLPVACFLLEEMLLTSPVESEIVHEILRQGLLLPWEYAPTIRSIMALLRWWVFQPAARRPPFLRTDLHGILPSEGDVESGLMEVYTERYIRRVQSLFDCRPSFGFETGQADVYRDGMAFLRAVAMGHYWRPTAKVWAALHTALLSMAQTHLAVPSKQEPVALPEYAGVFAAALTETILGAFVRSATNEAALWERLSAILQNSTRWRPILSEWARALHALTSLLLTEKHSLPNTPVASGKFTRITSIEDIAAELMVAPELPSPRMDTFLSWSPQLVAPSGLCFLWRNLLRILGSPSLIESAEGVELVVKALVSITDKLGKANSPYALDAVEALFDTFEVHTGRSFEGSRCAIMACLTSILLGPRGTSYSVLPDIWQPRFFLAVLHGIADKDARLAAVVLRATSYIYSADDLPSCTLLVPSFMRCIGSSLNGPLKSTESLNAIIRLLLSFSSFSDTYPKLPVPRLEVPLSSMSYSMPVAHTGDIGMTECVRHQVPCLLGLALDRMLEQQQSSVQRGVLDLPFTALLGSTVGLLANELVAQEEPNEALIDQYLSLLLSALDTGMATSSASGAVLDTLVALGREGDRMDPERRLFIAQSLLSILHANTSDDFSVYQGLLGWLLVMHSDKAMAASLSRQLLDHLLEGERTECKTLLLNHLIHQLGAHPAATPNLVSQPDVALALGNDSLLMMEQAEGSVHISSYNAVCQTSWTFTPLVSEANPSDMPGRLSLGRAVPMTKVEPYISCLPTGKPIEHGQMPKWSPEVSLEQSDVLASLLSYLDEEFPEARDPNAGPEYVPPERREATAEMREACEGLVRLEAEVAQQYIKAVVEPKEDEASVLYHRRAKPAHRPAPLAKFHLGRTLLSHLGMLQARPELGPQRFPPTLLSGSKALDREVEHLAQLPSHTQHKVALLYVPPDPVSEGSILSPDVEPSLAYLDFSRALASHRKVGSLSFTGGVSESECKEGRILAYECPTHSLVFHEPCRFAASSDLLNVKRHVGNDAVFIVWNEGDKPFDPSLIRSDYGNLQIVLTPRPDDGLYAVSIHADTRFLPERLAAGPLFDGALLPRALLAPLVRATAVAADRVLSSGSGPQHLSPAADRQGLIAQILEKNRVVGWSPDRVLAHIVQPPAGIEASEMPSPVVV